jgi:hypothetical protein
MHAHNKEAFSYYTLIAVRYLHIVPTQNTSYTACLQYLASEVDVMGTAVTP